MPGRNEPNTPYRRMSIIHTLLSAGLDAVAVVLLGWTTLTAVRARERPSSLPFAGMVASLTIWAAAQFLSELPGVSSGTALSSVASLGAFGAALVLPGAWLVYALGYTGRGIGLTRRRIVILAGIALPVIGSGVVLATGPDEQTLVRTLAPLLGTELLYVFILYAYATYLMVGLARTNARVSTLQIAVVISGVTAPYLVGAAGADGSAVADGWTVGLLLSGALLGGALRQYPVLTGFPKADYVARTRVVEGLREAVIVVDWENHVLDANETAARLFDRDATSMIGEPIQAIVEGLDGADLSAGSTEVVTLRTTEGRRRFQFSVSAVGGSDPEGEGDTDAVARTVLFRDVTDQEMREQRLTVLNRILRHNVRNELDVVLAYADQIDDPELRSGIREGATDLVELGDKARDVEEVMTASTGPPEPVDIAEIGTNVVEAHRTPESSVEITLERPDELVVATHQGVVEAVFSELLDNARTHAAGSPPSVEVRIRGGEDAAAELVVADNGPGIPDRERRILSEGDETQFKHGQGLGLWFVNWGVTELGGELEFGDNHPEGSVVTIRLYDRTL